MHTPDWLVQIYELTDAHAQQTLAGLLREVEDLTVSTGPDGPDHFVTIVLRDASRAHAVYQLVTSVDAKAILVHSSTEQMTDPEHHEWVLTEQRPSPDR